MRVAILGASGFTGVELLRLCASHPELDVVRAGADTQAGRAVSELYPSLAACYPSLAFTETTTKDVAGMDVVFSALPHGESQAFMGDLLGKVGLVVDLSADFRLGDENAWHQFYGQDVRYAGRWAYGLPELPGAREKIRAARTVAASP